MNTRSRILKIKDVKERCQEIAYWVIETLSHITRSIEPSPPSDWLSFKSLAPHDQSRAIAGGLYEKEEILKYVNAKTFAKQQDKDNVSWLTEVRGWLPEQDITSIGKINNKIEEISDGRIKPTKGLVINWNDQE